MHEQNLHTNKHPVMVTTPMKNQNLHVDIRSLSRRKSSTSKKNLLDDINELEECWEVDSKCCAQDQVRVDIDLIHDPEPDIDTEFAPTLREWFICTYLSMIK